MKAESEIYRMLPKTKELLEEDIRRRREELAKVSGQGAELWEGDQWHSTAYRDQQTRKELAIRFLQLIDRGGGRIEILSKPTQTDHIEIGHMVKIRLLDDADIIEAGVTQTLVHLLTREDSHYLGFLFDDLHEMVVSFNSPLGLALLDLRRGNVSSYLGNQRFSILNSEDAIKVSYLFNKEI